MTVGRVRVETWTDLGKGCLDRVHRNSNRAGDSCLRLAHCGSRHIVLKQRHSNLGL